MSNNTNIIYPRHHVLSCYRFVTTLLLLIIACSRITLTAATNYQLTNTKSSCSYVDISDALAAVLCDVEKGRWVVPANAPAVTNAGCLLGGDRCKQVMHIPTEAEVPPSPSPPEAKNKQYQELATIAERVVPKTWWRDGFSNDMLLLTHNDSDLPRKLFDGSKLRGKKLKNIVQCVTRQQFIRKSYPFDHQLHHNGQQAQAHDSKCSAMTDVAVKRFHDLWLASTDFGGTFRTVQAIDGSTVRSWEPDPRDNDALRTAAIDVLDYFYANYGGIWTGCFKLEKASDCRGALAAASLVAGVHLLQAITVQHIEFTESVFTSGYLLATLGRGLMHGDSSYTGNHRVTEWKIIPLDFIALQSAFLQLYTKSFGRIYSEQLNKYIPQAFEPNFSVETDKKFKHLSMSLEPVYTSLRNWMFTEASSLIDFGPYIPLVAFEEVRKDIIENNRKRILIDVGANGFFASPKYLLDSYAIFMPFTHAIMIEPEPHFSATVPPAYMSRYNITFTPVYVEVNTGGALDMLKMLPNLVKKEDFVVLKFDVDPNRYAQGPTMEWGFLFSLMQQAHVAGLVDELYIELHFHFPSLYWQHLHSNWEALDAFRYLRRQGAIVHSWP